MTDLTPEQVRKHLSWIRESYHYYSVSCGGLHHNLPKNIKEWMAWAKPRIGELTAIMKALQ